MGTWAANAAIDLLSHRFYLGAGAHFGLGCKFNFWGGRYLSN